MSDPYWEHPMGARARQISEEFDLGIQVENDEEATTSDIAPTGIFYGDLGYLEHVIHELAHARILGIELGPRLSERIGDELSGMRIDDPFNRYAEINEGFTWAVEWACIQQFDTKMTWDDVISGAIAQDCEECEVSIAYELLPWVREYGNEIANFIKGGPMPKTDLNHILSHLRPGDVVEALIDFDPRGANVRPGDVGVVFRESEYHEKGSGPMVRWVCGKDGTRRWGVCNVYEGVVRKITAGMEYD